MKTFTFISTGKGYNLRTYLIAYTNNKKTTDILIENSTESGYFFDKFTKAGYEFLGYKQL